MGVAYFLDVVPGLQFLQQQHCLLCLLVSLNFVVHHQGDLRDLLNTVPCGNMPTMSQLFMKFLRSSFPLEAQGHLAQTRMFTNHLRQHKDSRQLSLCAVSDANYTIIARVFIKGKDSHNY